MKNKAQLAGQVFVYIIALIIVVLVVFFGWKAIRIFLDQSEQVSAVKFQSDLESSVKLLYSGTGSVREKELIVPTSAKMVCFIDSSKQVDELDQNHVCRPGSGNMLPDLFILCDSWQSNVLQNVFLIPHAENPIYIDHLVVENNNEGYDFLKCFEVVQGRINIRLESVAAGIKVGNI